MVSKKTLYILRHAKAEAAAAGQEDHARALASKGAKAAEAMGHYLKKEKILPEKVLCSSAVRTVETLMKLEEVYHRPLPVEYSDKLYMASANGMLALIGAVPEDVSTLLLVGHNPGMHQLCYRLAKSGDRELLGRMSEKFPTCAFAEIELGAVSWRDAGKAGGELRRFMTPKMLG